MSATPYYKNAGPEEQDSLRNACHRNDGSSEAVLADLMSALDGIATSDAEEPGCDARSADYADMAV